MRDVGARKKYTEAMVSVFLIPLLFLLHARRVWGQLGGLSGLTVWDVIDRKSVV